MGRGGILIKHANAAVQLLTNNMYLAEPSALHSVVGSRDIDVGVYGHRRWQHNFLFPTLASGQPIFHQRRRLNGNGLEKKLIYIVLSSLCSS